MTPPLTHRRAGLLLLAFSMVLPLRAQTQDAAPAPNPREILRDALYAEEVTRDATKAAEHYSKVLELYRAQQPFAATALFRLAEVRRKQGNKEEAAKLYQQLLREFPNAEVEGKLARENLAAMGGTAPPDAAGPAEDNDETKELRRLQELAQTSPDLARDPKLLEYAASKGQTRVIAFLIESGIDPQSGSFLASAVMSGNLKAVELLISKGCNPAKAPHDAAIIEAAKRKYYSIGELLLKSGANANYREKVKPSSSKPTSMSALHYAAGKNDERMCRLLLDHGADPNFMPEICYPSSDTPGNREAPLGSPLHQAIASDSERDASLPALLLKAGAKPGLAATGTGLTPLHFAAKQKDLPVLRLLLEAGAEVNAPTLGMIGVGNGQPNAQLQEAGVTALDYAISNGPEEAVRLLLAKGADPNLADENGETSLDYAWGRNRALMTLLIEHGAKTASPDLLIGVVTLNGGVDLVKQLLDAGGDPNKVSERHKKSAIQSAIEADRPSLEAIQLLLDRGAKVDESWLKESMGQAEPEVRSLLAERFLLPELLSRPAITLTYADQPGESWTLAKREGEAAPGQLEALLLGGVSLPQLNIFLQKGGQRRTIPELVTIYRREAGGSIKKIRGRLDGSAPMPKLEWSDVVELARDPSIVNYNIMMGSAFSPDVIWNLRQHLAVPITVNLTGQPRPMTLRGSCLVYHPGEAVAPILRAGPLAKLLWSRVTPDALSVRRAGWPEIRIAAGTAEWLTFDFQAGDEVTPVYREALAELEKAARKEVVTLTVPGTTFGRTWYANHPPTAPTLVEVIADLYASWQPLVLGTLPEAPADRWGAIATRQVELSFHTPQGGLANNPLSVPAIPEYPDFSKIRIHRQSAEGVESTLDVDLTKAFAATTTTREEAMKYDVKLQPGDWIELPQQKREGAAAWKGFSDAEARFIGKVLSGTFQYTDGNGTLRRKGLVWQPVRWLESAGGPVPLPPEPGVASSAASFQVDLGMDATPRLAREDSEEGAMGVDFFIRDGDRLRVSSTPNALPVPVPQPAQQMQPGQPQPRPIRNRVPPPAPNR